MSWWHPVCLRRVEENGMDALDRLLDELAEIPHTAEPALVRQKSFFPVQSDSETATARMQRSGGRQPEGRGT
jgi:hypothetical protein